MSSLDFIIAGLGNPGKEYEGTRHNAGFMALDYVASKVGCSISNSKFKGLCAMGKLSSKRVLLLKPQTYMNLSGESLIEAMHFYKISPNKVILLFDDISLPPGKLRIRTKGSHGGQNGVKNIITVSGSEYFLRIKIGVGNKPNPNWDLSNWVLSKFSKDECDALKSSLEKVYSSLELIINGSIEKAMHLYN